jgi:serine/threonine protein kinase
VKLRAPSDRALHREMLREVAIKTLKNVAAAGSDSAQRFQREVQAAARLVHPNVVVAHDAGEASGVRYLAMEIVEGADLSSVVRNSGTMTVSLAVDCICQAAFVRLQPVLDMHTKTESSTPL